MANNADRSGPNVATSNVDDNRLKYACDAGILCDLDSEDSNNPLTHSDSEESSESPPRPSRRTDLAASFRVFAESAARMEVAEMEMIKAREASRWEAEKRRLESEAELTRLMVQTQLQIASVVAGKRASGKRKRVETDDDQSLISTREGGALLLSLLQCNFML